MGQLKGVYRVVGAVVDIQSGGLSTPYDTSMRFRNT